MANTYVQSVANTNNNNNNNNNKDNNNNNNSNDKKINENSGNSVNNNKQEGPSCSLTDRINVVRNFIDSIENLCASNMADFQESLMHPLNISLFTKDAEKVVIEYERLIILSPVNNNNSNKLKVIKKLVKFVGFMNKKKE